MKLYNHNIVAALKFLRISQKNVEILRPEYESRGIVNDCKLLPSIFWEVFIAKLTDDECDGRDGYADLNKTEVKSLHKFRTSHADYQRHLKNYKLKDKTERRVNHIFCVYSNWYRDVEVYLKRPDELTELLDALNEKAKNTYKNNQSNRRSRDKVSMGNILEGKLLIRVVDCQLLYPMQ